MIGDIAHICNRGVDKRKIFSDVADYGRFRDNLFLLNNVPGKIRTKHEDIFKNHHKLPKQEKLVEILKWSLMPNHYHILLYENIEGGILEFTKRLGNAYTKYFNSKNGKRSGYLFQNSARIILVAGAGHMPYLPIYIDLNASDLFEAKSNVGIFDRLKLYEWSSMREYFGAGGRETIINTGLFYKIFETNEEKYLNDLKGFLEDRTQLEIELEGVDLAG